MPGLGCGWCGWHRDMAASLKLLSRVEHAHKLLLSQIAGTTRWRGMWCPTWHPLACVLLIINCSVYCNHRHDTLARDVVPDLQRRVADCERAVQVRGGQSRGQGAKGGRGQGQQGVAT